MRYQLHTSQSRYLQNFTVAIKAKGNPLVESNLRSQIFVKIIIFIFLFFFYIIARIITILISEGLFRELLTSSCKVLNRKIRRINRK